MFVFSLLALAFIGQMPVVAAHNLGIDPKSANYGLLYACFGTGALVGAISIGTVFARTLQADDRPGLPGRLRRGPHRVRPACGPPLPAYFVVAVVGAFYFAFITALNTALQTRLADAVRGRVMALWIMGFGGTVALGNLLVGPVVSAVGITDVLLFGAAVAVALAWYADVRVPGEATGRLSALPARSSPAPGAGRW